MKISDYFFKVCFDPFVTVFSFGFLKLALRKLKMLE